MTPGVWQRHAGQWARVGPPLRPSGEDISFVERVVAEVSRPRVLLLGVTPELARLAWPAGTELVAVDKEPRMIAEVWPGFPAPGKGAVLGDWRTLAPSLGPRDVVASDGCFGVLRFSDYPVVLERLRAILAPDGRFVFRVFVRPPEPETPEAVLEALAAGRIGSFHAFKLRLLMAAEETSARGVRVGDVFDVWAARGPAPEVIAAELGWPLEQVTTIEAYRGNDAIYTFPQAHELLEVLAAGGFEVITRQLPSYELGERCPSFECRLSGSAQVKNS